MHSHKRKSRRILNRVLLAIICGALASLILQGCANKDTPAASSKKGMGRMQGGPVPVTVRKVLRKDVPIEIQVVGNVEAYLTVAVKSQVSGEITQVFFREGDFVKKGDPLFTIDPRTYQAQLNQAQANLVKDGATLAQVRANLARDQAQQEYAQSEAERYGNLLEHHLISKEQAEQMRTNARAVAAAVSADEAAIQSAQATMKATEAAMENSKVMLGYTAIRSPLNGRTGNLDVKQGNVISTNTSLMTINQVEPIYVTFAVPEDQLKSVGKGQLVIVSAQDDESKSQTGTLTFIDNTVDSTTGTIRLKATFPNAKKELWPGEFVRAKLRLGIQQNALIVPNQAVQTGQDGMYVFVVKSDHTVESRPVITGARIDQDMVIEKGLELGETIVLEGQLRLAPGSQVQLAGEGRGGFAGQSGGSVNPGGRGQRGEQVSGQQPGGQGAGQGNGQGRGRGRGQGGGRGGNQP